MKFDIEEILGSQADTGNRNWNNDIEYIDRLYKLLREDFLKPLRKDLKLLLDGCTKFSHLMKYEKVSLVSRNLEQKVIYKLKFNEETKNLENSSRLTLGSLIILIDKHRNITFGRIAERRVEELKSGVIGIELFNNDAISITTLYDIFEYTVHYEADKHTLENLLQLKTIPFRNIIVEKGRKQSTIQNCSNNYIWTSLLLNTIFTTKTGIYQNCQRSTDQL